MLFSEPVEGRGLGYKVKRVRIWKLAWPLVPRLYGAGAGFQGFGIDAIRNPHALQPSA